MRYCPMAHISRESDCTSATVLGFQRPGLHCPRCGHLTHEVGDLSGIQPRLMRIWREIHTGDASKEIAARLNISAHTLKVYISHLMSASGLKNRVQLALAWERMTRNTMSISEALRFEQQMAAFRQRKAA